MYRIVQTEWFEKQYEKLSGSEQRIVESIKNRLVENPRIGDILRHPMVREMRVRDKRLYFLVFEEWLAVLIVWIGDKKAQQKTINTILYMLPDYRKKMREKITLLF